MCDTLLDGTQIAPERLDLRGPEDTHESHLAQYRGMDIALDTFPYHGTTTTCEALWMGVPVITLVGHSHVSRVGASLLENIGLPGLAARSEEDYVRIAAELAQDVERLTHLRSTLRNSMKNSRLLDARAFSRSFEDALRHMWAAWVARG